MCILTHSTSANASYHNPNPNLGSLPWQDIGRNTLGDDVMLQMGGDFGFENADVWFKNLEILMAAVNKEGRVNVSTNQCARVDLLSLVVCGKCWTCAVYFEARVLVISACCDLRGFSTEPASLLYYNTLVICCYSSRGALVLHRLQSLQTTKHAKTKERNTRGETSE